MSLYSFSVKAISRSKGESAVKIAAYQGRDSLYDERNGVRYDFAHKTDLVHSEIILPANAPPDFYNPQVLCNAIEKAEKRYDSRLGRTIIAALQNELNLEDQIVMVREFVNETFISLGMCAIVSVHGGEREIEAHMDGKQTNTLPNNPHVHILLTDRPVDRDGFCPVKNRGWNKKAHVRRWRELWARAVNREFERQGINVRLRHDCLEVQQIQREPTIHLGRTTKSLEDRGIQTDRGDTNRAIEARNKEREEQKKQREQERELRRKRDRGLSR